MMVRFSESDYSADNVFLYFHDLVSRLTYEAQCAQDLDSRDMATLFEEAADLLKPVKRKALLASELFRKSGGEYMEPNFRPLLPEERLYVFRQPHDVSMKAWLIGHIRGYFTRDTSPLEHDWNAFRKPPDEKDFQRDLTILMESLRFDGNLLHTRREMAKFCATLPREAALDGISREYGIRIDTQKYSYLMRLNPNEKEYSLYCWCYVRESLDQFLEGAGAGIRFVDIHGQNLFVLPDGGQIQITFSDGAQKVHTCRYIDPTHLYVSNTVFHIDQLAERVHDLSAKIEPVKDGDH